MSEINVSDYSIFEKAIVTTANMGTCFANNTSKSTSVLFILSLFISHTYSLS